MKKKYQKKRTYKLLPLSNSLAKVYKKSSKQNDPYFISLMKNWETLVGKEYAKILSPIKISSKDKTLTVSSERNFSLESNYVTPMLLDKINRFYGYKAYKNINYIFRKNNNVKKDKKIVIKSETSDKIEEIVCNIKNDELKKTLERLGKSMARKGRIK